MMFDSDSRDKLLEAYANEVLYTFVLSSLFLSS